MLASWPLPVYLTTNYDDFMVKALEANNRKAHRDFCRWNKELADYPGVWQREPNYQPTADAPIVYHMHGRSDLPNLSLRPRTTIWNLSTTLPGAA